jgi:hypothetical protein
MLITPGRQTCDTHIIFASVWKDSRSSPEVLQEWQEWERSGLEGEWEGYRYRKFKAGVEQSTWQKKKIQKRMSNEQWNDPSRMCTHEHPRLESNRHVNRTMFYLLSKNQRL